MNPRSVAPVFGAFFVALAVAGSVSAGGRVGQVGSQRQQVPVYRAGVDRTRYAILPGDSGLVDDPRFDGPYRGAPFESGHRCFPERKPSLSQKCCD